MNEITIAIIAFAAGYFFAMYRKDNIVTHVHMNRGFFNDIINGKAEECLALERRLKHLRREIAKEGVHHVQNG